MLHIRRARVSLIGGPAMRSRAQIAVLLGALVVAASVAAVVPSAFAGPNTLYCLNGVTTTLPATVTGGSTNHGTHSTTLSEAVASVLIASHGGTFAVGWGNGAWLLWTPDSGVPVTSLEPGYTQYTILNGACTDTASPVTHVGVCKLLPRGDGTTGLFQEIAVADWNDADGKYFDAPAANWVEGLGLTCDKPLALGYRAAGHNVAWGGEQDPGHDPSGVRGSGFNDIYPYFVK